MYKRYWLLLQHFRWVCFLSLAYCIMGVLWISASRHASVDGAAEFFDAAKRGDDSAVARALARGTPVDLVEDGSNCTALMYASRFGRLDVAKRLLGHGGDVRRVARGFGGPLASAAGLGGPDMVRLLLEHDADPNLRGCTGYSPLMQAVTFECESPVDLLLNAGADVNAKDCGGNTALIIAAFNANEAIMQRLIKAGADVNVGDNDGTDMAMRIAAAERQTGQCPECVEAFARQPEWERLND